MKLLQWRLLVFPLLVVLFLPLPANTQLLGYTATCNASAGTYAAGSTFRRNLDTVLSSITTDAKIEFGFCKVSAGTFPDQVEVMGLCSANVGSDDCRACLKTSRPKLLRSCPNQKDATSYYDPCMLRYYPKPEPKPEEAAPPPPPSPPSYIVKPGIDFDRVNRTLVDLFNRIRNQAAAGGDSLKCASGITQTGRSTMVYGVVQCRPDFSGPDCDYCIGQAIARITDGKFGRVVVGDCWLAFGWLDLDEPAESCRDSGSSSFSNGTQTGNFTNELASLLDSLPAKAASANFSMETSPGGGIHALYLCRGDVVSGEVCRACVADAARGIQERCPGNRSAIIWRENCMVRYSDESFFGVPEMIPMVIRRDEKNATTVEDGATTTNNAAMALVYALASFVPYASAMYGANYSTARGQPNYAMAQCSMDLSAENCQMCLNQLITVATGCCMSRVGWQVLTPSCSLMYNQSGNPHAPGNDYGNSHGSDSSGVSKIVVIGGSTATVLVLFIAVTCLYCYYIWFWSRRRLTGGEILIREGIQVTDHNHDTSNSTELQYYTLATVQAATNNFSDRNKLGEGGFGPVYKGRLPSGEEIAVKRLSMTSKQGHEEFRNEVMVILKLQHKNLVRLLGCCLERGEKLLVYEYLANTSLDVFLFDARKCKELDWEKRANIIAGTARGLVYLHEDSRLKIIHRDLKASNVLLDDEMNPKISDFGTARIFGGDQHEASTDRVVGTYGYMAPEYALGGVISTKSDVYSFGILMLEIISGKKNREPFNHEQATSLLSLAWEKWSEGKGDKLIDQNIAGGCSVSDALRWIHVGLLCTQDDPAERPDMSKVVLMLGSTAVYLPQPLKPPFSVGNFYVGDDGDGDDDDRSCSSRGEGTSYSSPTSFRSIVNCCESA